MGLRPAKCYRSLKGKAYTRKAIRVMKKAFVRGVPGPKIRIFDMGNKSKREWKWEVDLVAKDAVQVRHNQLEAVRMAVNKILMRKMGRLNYFFRVRAYPHHVLRENPLATGAGADRFQKGMRQAFGRPIGTAARVKPGKVLLSVWVDREEFIPIIKEAYRIAKLKLSGDYRVEIKEFDGVV